MSKLAKYRKGRKKAKRNPAPKRNPPIVGDVVEYILPGFAAFAATRVATRIATGQISKRWPKMAKHAGALASVTAFAGAWFGVHRVKYLDKYHHPIVVGAGLAAVQNLVQLYLPKFGQLLGDPMPTIAPITQPLIRTQVAQQQMPELADYQSRVPAGFKPTTANEWYSYNDSFDAGAYKGQPEQAQAPVPGQASAAPSASEPDEMQIDNLLDNSDLVDSDLGSFS